MKKGAFREKIVSCMKYSNKTQSQSFVEKGSVLYLFSLKLFVIDKVEGNKYDLF